MSKYLVVEAEWLEEYLGIGMAHFAVENGHASPLTPAEERAGEMVELLLAISYEGWLMEGLDMNNDGLRSRFDALLSTLAEQEQEPK